MHSGAPKARMSEHVGWGPSSASAACSGRHGYLVEVGVLQVRRVSMQVTNSEWLLLWW